MTGFFPLDRQTNALFLLEVPMNVILGISCKAFISKKKVLKSDNRTRPLRLFKFHYPIDDSRCTEQQLYKNMLHTATLIIFNLLKKWSIIPICKFIIFLSMC